MRFIWLLASLASALLTVLFCYTLVYYFMHRSPTWLGVLALFSVVVFWMLLATSDRTNYALRWVAVPKYVSNSCWERLAPSSVICTDRALLFGSEM
jgi:hypothetical protein